MRVPLPAARTIVSSGREVMNHHQPFVCPPEPRVKLNSAAHVLLDKTLRNLSWLASPLGRAGDKAYGQDAASSRVSTGQAHPFHPDPLTGITDSEAGLAQANR